MAGTMGSVSSRTLEFDDVRHDSTAQVLDPRYTEEDRERLLRRPIDPATPMIMSASAGAEDTRPISECIALGEPIGEGKSAVVYACEALHNNKAPAALKVSVYGYDSLREVNALQALSGSPFVVTMLGHGGSAGDEVCCMLMERCSGTLQELNTLVVPQMDEEDLQFYIACVLQGLVATHEAGFLHRDLKSENVLISASNGYGALTPGGTVAEQPSPNVLQHPEATWGWMRSQDHRLRPEQECRTARTDRRCRGHEDLLHAGLCRQRVRVRHRQRRRAARCWVRYRSGPLGARDLGVRPLLPFCPSPRPPTPPGYNVPAVAQWSESVGPG